MKNFSILIFSLLLFSSCEFLFIEPTTENTPLSNFETLWKEVDEKYAFFTLKSIDWQDVYNQNLPRIKQDMTDEELFDVLSDMLFVLKDGHVNLSSAFDVSRNWTWYTHKPANFDFNIIERYYLGDDYRITGPLYNTVIDSVAYIYYASFGSVIDEDELDYLIKDFSYTKGLIFDIRGNGGGYLSNVDLLCKKFADKDRTVFLQQYKTGPGHNDFSDFFAFSVEADTAVNYRKPVVLLTNRQCYSAANDLANRFKNFEHVTIIGDTTGGGGGLPISFELPNGWIARFSTTQTFSPDGFNIEMGVPPHIAINFLQEDVLANRDTYIEFAILHIQSKHNNLLK